MRQQVTILQVPNNFLLLIQEKPSRGRKKPYILWVVKQRRSSRVRTEAMTRFLYLTILNVENKLVESPAQMSNKTTASWPIHAGDKVYAPSAL